jgi:pre-mRNA-splicing factor ATP-dependent RNA helicase DHX38/PRP16
MDGEVTEIMKSVLRVYFPLFYLYREWKHVFFPENGVQWASTEDRELWEEEQKRLDREWYAIDEGYDDDNNPFSNVSEDYTKTKEEQLEQRRKKRMSAQQRQINKVM